MTQIKLLFRTQLYSFAMPLHQGSRGFLSGVVLQAWSFGLMWAAITQRINKSRLVRIEGGKILTDVCNCTALWSERTVMLLLPSGTLTLLILSGVLMVLLLLAWPLGFISHTVANCDSSAPPCTMRVGLSPSQPASCLSIVSQTPCMHAAMPRF